MGTACEMGLAQEDWDPPAFHVVVEVNADPPCVTVWGDIDLASIAAFRDALEEAKDTGAHHLAIDLTHVSFMGSTGLRELVRAQRDIERIELRNPNWIVRHALEAVTLPANLVICG